MSSEEVIGWGDIRMTYYVQDVEGGYSAPGMMALMDTKTQGGTLHVPVADRFNINAKVDKRVQDMGLETNSQEINVGYQLNDRWDISAGYRKDERLDNSPIVVLTQEQGERTDAVLQVQQ
jgi:hypothetical protein